MNFLKRLYSQLKQTATTGISGVCSALSMIHTTGNSTFTFPYIGSNVQQGLFYLAPPWNLTLALLTVAPQLTLLTAGRPVSSLLMAILVPIVSPFTFKSNEPLSFLLRERSHCCSRNLTKWIKMYFMRRSFLTHIMWRYLTFQFPRRLMKALLTDSLMPVPCTRFTADCGSPTLTIHILE